LALWKIINEEDAVLIPKKLDARTFPADFCTRKQTKIQWIHGLRSQNYVDNPNNVRRDASRHFRNKKNAYPKAKIEEFETNSKIKIIRDFYRGINDFKKGYQPRTNTVKMTKVIWFQTPTAF